MIFQIMNDSDYEHSVCACGQEFSQAKNLYTHLRKVHNIEPIVSKPELKFPCSVCVKKFSSKSSLTRHNRITHRITRPLREKRLICPHDSCNEKVANYVSLRQHLVDQHNIQVDYEELTFYSIKEFENWKEEIQQNTLSSYTKDTKPKKLSCGATRSFYDCHRSYGCKSKGDKVRATKSIGSNKIGKACPSRLEVTVRDRKGEESIVLVKYWKTHYGHIEEIQRITLTKDTRAQIAEWENLNHDKKERKSRRKLDARPYKNYTIEKLELAVKAVAKAKMTSRKAEERFGVPRRTIINKLKNKHTNKVGMPTKLNEKDEQKLIDIIITSAKFGYRLTKLDLRIILYNYLKGNEKDHLFNGKIPGEKWVRSFLDRHNEELSIRPTQNIYSSREKLKEDEIYDFYKNLIKTINGVPPSNIFTYGETNCSDDPESLKVIFKRAIKYPERTPNSVKGCISLMFSGTADGKCLPPYIVYRAENLKTYLKEGVTFDGILESVRNSKLNDNIFPRIALLNRKDIHNIVRDFNINYPFKRPRKQK